MSADTYDYTKMKSTVEDALKRVFNPEFLNRLDDVIVFHPLSKEHIGQIVTILLKEVQRRLRAGGVPDFLEETADVRSADRPVARGPQHLLDGAVVDLERRR
mgnify:CR=1 FL=1